MFSAAKDALKDKTGDHPEYAKLLSARWAELTGTEDACDFMHERVDFCKHKEKA